MSKTDADILLELDEPFASGLFEKPKGSPVVRWYRAVRRELEHRGVTPYDGGPLYPSGACRPMWRANMLMPNLVATWSFNTPVRDEKLAEADEDQRRAIGALDGFIEDLREKLSKLKTIQTLGGGGYIHCVPNYSRVVNEGFEGHVRRIEAALTAAREAGDRGRIELELGLLDVIEGIRAWHAAMVDHLAAWEPTDDAGRENRDRLVAALTHVPFKPARTFFEALVAYNLTYYLDYCDNPGRIDQVLWPFYDRDIRRGRISRGDAVALIRALTDSFCANESWSAAIGGTTPEGTPGYNDLTLICLETVKGRHRPNYLLRIRRDMPWDVWDAAFDALATGCGQPALYNEEGYYASLKEADVGVTDEDLSWWNGGGCTETMVQGLSNVGSLDAGINLPLVLDGVLKGHLGSAESFDELVAAYKTRTAEVVGEMTTALNGLFTERGAFNPHPIRTLLVDDCIENGRDFQAGGARYNWSVVNVAGLSNVADSLAAIREVVFETGELTGAELRAVLDRDFEGDEPLRQRLARCPRFGNDQPEVDALAADLARHVFEEFRKVKIVRGNGRFLPSCIMFVTYGGAGAHVGATPDGRRAGEPIADSIGPVYGRDTHGPTATLKSVTRLPLHLATGTPICNIRFSKQMFTNTENRRRLAELIRAYFDMGGMQLQANVVDQEVLRDAIAYPEKHEDLIIRIGGYSMRFNDLTDQLKHSLLERTEHSV